MTPRERYMTALRGGMPDRLPLIIWNNKLLGGRYDEAIFELGVCLIVKSCVWKMRYEGVQQTSEEAPADGPGTRRVTRFKTPAGNLEMIEKVLPNTAWIESFPFKSPDDYEALEALISARSYEEDFESFSRDDALRGDQSLARPMSIRSPMQEIIYEFMGIENFSVEWLNNRDRVIHLESILKQDWEKRVRMTAESPAQFAVVDGNTEYSVVGEDRYKSFFAPRINEACEILQAKEKLAGAHLDGNNRMLAPIVADTKLDYIESFTPAPETDLSIAEAREAWPGKSLIIHFPSSVHLSGVEAIETVGRQYLREAAPGRGIIIGALEDLPNRGEKSMIPFYTFFEKHGKLPLSC